MASGFDYESWESYKELGKYDEYREHRYTIQVPDLDADGNPKKDENGNIITKSEERVEYIKTGRVLNIHNGSWLNYTTSYNHNVFISVVNSQKNQHTFNGFNTGGVVKVTDREYKKIRANSWLRVFDNPGTDYTFWLGETSESKRKKSKLKEALILFCALDNSYELGLTAAEIYSPALAYAEAKAKEARKWWEAFETGQGILSVVLLVVSIIFIWVPGEQPLFAAALANFVGTSVATMATILNITYTIATLAAFAGNLYYQHTANKAQGIAASAGRYSTAKSALQNQMEAQKRKNTLTSLIVYGGYSIYANGSIYNEQSAGSQTFACTIPYDAMKGINGDLKKDDIASMIHSRGGAELAGGVRFHSKLLDVDFPLQSASYSAEQKIDMLKMRLKKTISRVGAGFTKLFENYFNADENGQNTYNRVFKLHTEPIKQQIKNESFLDKIKNYSKDLMADFFFINENAFKPKIKSTEPVWLYFNSETYKAYMDDEKFSIEQKAKRYINAMKILFDAIADAADESILGNLNFIYAASYTKTDDGYRENTNTLNFSLDETQGYIYEAFLASDDTGTRPADRKVYQSAVSFLNKNYYSYGYTDGAVLYHTDNDDAFSLAEFEALDGYFKDDFEQSRLNGDFVKKIFEECLSRFLNIGGKKFWLLREKKFARADTKNGASFENEFFAVPLSDEAYKHLTTPLYVPENLKEAFAEFDFSTINIGLGL